MKNTSISNGYREHILLTALGTKPQGTMYSLGGQKAEATFAPLALLQLLPREKRPGKVSCLVTEEARAVSWPGFSEQLYELGVIGEALDIPAADSSLQMGEIIRQVAQWIPPEVQVTLDITHGPRSIPFVFYALALYLSSFRGVEMIGAWYGKFESEEDAKPLISLQPLLDLPQWFYAIRLFKDEGLARPLARRFDAASANVPKGSESTALRTSAEALNAFSGDYEAGFPVELGNAAGKLCNTLETNPMADMPGLNVPLTGELEKVILAAADPLRFGPEGLSGGRRSGDWKKDLTLTKRELQRQAHLIDRYLERGQNTLALGLMREWIVSLGALHRDLQNRWLVRDVRERLERELAAMCQPALRAYLTDEQREWATFIDRLSQARNQMAHHGMKPEIAKTQVAGRIQQFWGQIKTADQAWAPFGGGQGRLLITPLGLSPGVLYAAIKHVQPNVVLVLCSDLAKENLGAALRHAGYSRTPEILIMQDPFNGTDEIGGLLEQARKICVGADEVLVNITGGTTLMGIVVQKLTEQARRDQRRCKRFLLTDKRSLEEQRDKPWVKSDLFWLDKQFEGW